MHVTHNKIDAAAMSRPTDQTASTQVQRARLYHFFQLALAHPGEDGFDYFSQQSTRQEFIENYSCLFEKNDKLLDRGLEAAETFFVKLQDHSYEEIESAYIGMFSTNFPHLPCPPYGSLFTAEDSDKRLDEMLAIKQFYQQNGVDIADSFDDLPDHLCVELEFSQLMCFRENEASTAEEAELFVGIRNAQAEFLDRFLLPLGNSLADTAAAAMPDNLYGSLLEAMRCYLIQHRQELGLDAESITQGQEIQS